MFKKKDKDKSSILETFNSQVSNIIKLIDKYLPKNPDVIHIKRLVKIANETNALLMLEKCEDKFWENKNNIMDRNIDFFKNSTFDEYIYDDEYKPLINRLIVLMKNTYDHLNENDKENLWNRINIMLNCIINYKLIKGNHK
jgi:hypothetical protein